MKKVKKILIVVLIFVVTLNVNYLGMMDKTVIVKSDEYKEGNTDNLVLNKILSDNELKAEIPHMFNYASNGNYTNSDHDELNNPNYITNGLYSSEDEDGTTYYYRGNIDNNYIQFGEYEEDYYVYRYNDIDFVTLTSCKFYRQECTENNRILKYKKGTPMYFRIVRINGDGSLRLIYNGIDTNVTDNDIMVGHSAYSMGSGSVYYPKHTGYMYDNGTDNFVKKEVDTWYNNTLGQSNIYDDKVLLGRYCSDSSGYRYDEIINGNVFSSYDRLGQAETNFVKDNAPSFICPDTSESYGGDYRLKVGLITADELVFAGESVGVSVSSYLNPEEDGLDLDYWSMTPSLFRNNRTDGSVFSSSLYSSNVVLNYSMGLRPVINVSTEGMTLTGDGTIDNPYVLEEVQPNNSYKGKVTIEVGSSVDDITAFEEALDLNGVTWTVNDSSIAKIENGKIIGLKNGTTVITGVDANGNTYEIEVTVISNPVTNSALYIGIGLILILILGTGVYITYRIKNVVKNN